VTADATLKAFEDCLKTDALYRGPKDLADCVALKEYYEQRAEQRVKDVNRVLGVGLLDVADHRPLQIGLLRYAIDRQAVVYARPATRHLRRAEGRLDSKDPETQLMREVYEKSNVDLVMRRVDRYANLLQVVALRIYALADRLEVRLFSPDLVRRNPDPNVQNDLSRDESFALKVGADQWEFWQRHHELDAPTDREQWSMAVVQWSGEPRTKWWPFGQGSRLLVPPIFLPKAPAMLIYEQLGDEAWPSPRNFRLAATETINAMGNDLWAGQRHDTHNTRVWKGLSAEDLPAARGPGREIAVNQPPSQVEVQDLSPQTQLGPSAEIQQQTVGYYLVTEDLPPDDLDRNRQTVTGAAQKTRLFGLVERRAAQSMLAPTNEQRLWTIGRHQWNLRAASPMGQALGLKPLAEDTLLEVELAPMDLPVDDVQYYAAAEAALRLGVKSRLEIRMEKTGANRDRALDAMAQVKKDEEAMGPLPAPAPAASAGPNKTLADGRLPEEEKDK
jgi:hypothetical protein